MKKFIVTSIICLFTVMLFGQNNKIIIKKDKNGIVEYVKFPKESSENKQLVLPQNSKDFFNEYLKINKYDEFILIPKKTKE